MRLKRQHYAGYGGPSCPYRQQLGEVKGAMVIMGAHNMLSSGGGRAPLPQLGGDVPVVDEAGPAMRRAAWAMGRALGSSGRGATAMLAGERS